MRMIQGGFDHFEKLSQLSVEVSSLSNYNGLYSLFLIRVKYIMEIVKGVSVNMRLSCLQHRSQHWIQMYAA